MPSPAKRSFKRWKIEREGGGFEDLIDHRSDRKSLDHLLHQDSSRFFQILSDSSRFFQILPPFFLFFQHFCFIALALMGWDGMEWNGMEWDGRDGYSQLGILPSDSLKIVFGIWSRF